MVRQRSAKPLFIGSIPIAASIALALAAPGPKPALPPPLFERFTPEMELITLPGAGGQFHSFRALRQPVRLWGRELVVLVYSGPLARGQAEANHGRYSLITIPRNPAEETLFLEREVWPALTSPFLSAGGLRGLTPGDVLPPDDPRLPRLEQNLLRVSWYPLVRDLGVAQPGGGALAREAAYHRLRATVIGAGERNGFLHESQHALDEAHKVYPEEYRQPFRDRIEAEVRATLAAVAHSGHPHYALYHAVRQYRQRLPTYEMAVARVLRALVAEILRRPEEAPAVRLTRNVMLQLPRLPAEVLRARAAQAMATLFATTDREAGYELDYTRHEPMAEELYVGTLRGEIRPEDLPPVSSDPDDPPVFWRIEGERVETAGMHMYLSDRDVQVADAGVYGLALSGEGYLAAHMRLPGGAGPWRLEISGGRFEVGATEGEQLPVRVLAGPDEAPIPFRPRKEGGLFRADLPTALAAQGILRLIVLGLPGAGSPAFVTGLRLLPASSADDSGPRQEETDSSSERVNRDSRR